MGVFEWGNFPYSDFHSLNLDWILNTLKNFGVIIDDIPDMIDKAVKDAISDERLTELILNIVKDYMINVKFPPNGITPAKGDGTTDDAVAIQGCIDYAESIGGGCVFLPSGKYLTSGLNLKNNVGLNGMQGASLVLKGGSDIPLITSVANNVFLSGMTLDCNSEVQVNDINTLVFSGDNCRLKDLIIKGGARSLSYVGGGVLQGDCLYFDSAINTALVISGNVIAQLNDLYFKSISEVSGESAMFISSNDGSYTNVVINAKVPIGIKCDGNNNRFDALIKNATTDYVDTHKTNSWDIAFSTKIERYENKQVNITSDLTVNANHETRDVTESTENVSGTKTINSEDIILNPTNPLTYKKPTDFSQKYKSIQFKDINNNNYNVLVGDEKSYTSVTDFGADATGIADSTEAVQKSIDLLGYAFFTPGSYLINNCQLKSNTFIFGIGATLFYDKNGVNDSVFTTYVEPFSESNNIIIKNLKFTVKNHTNTEYGRCLMLNGCKNVKIENCIFENWNGDAILIDNHGILSDSSKYYNIINCKFFNDGKARQAISIVGGRYITIRNCYFNNTTSFNMPGAIDVEPYENYNFNMDNIYIINCTSENNNRPLLNSYLIFNNNVDLVIDGCNVINGDLRDGSIFNGIAHIENINGNIKYKITNCYIKSDEIGLQSSASTGIVSSNIFENCFINSGYKNFNNNNPDESIEITKNIFNRTKKKNEVNAILIKAASGKQVSITENIFNVFDPELYGCIGIDGATAKSFTLCDNIYKELNNSNFGYIVNGLDVNNLIKGNIAPKEINIIYNVGCAESVIINPSTAIAAKGETVTFNAILTGNNPLDVEWELIGSSTSSINNGTVSISSDEVAEILTVKATAKGVNRLEAYGSVIIKNK